MCLRPIKRKSEFSPCSTSLFRGAGELPFPLPFSTVLICGTQLLGSLSAAGQGPLLGSLQAWLVPWVCLGAVLEHSMLLLSMSPVLFTALEILCSSWLGHQCVSASEPQLGSALSLRKPASLPVSCKVPTSAFPAGEINTCLSLGPAVHQPPHGRYSTDFSQVQLGWVC